MGKNLLGPSHVTLVLRSSWGVYEIHHGDYGMRVPAGGSGGLALGWRLAEMLRLLVHLVMGTQ